MCIRDRIQTDTAETTDPGTYFYSWDDEQGYKDYSIGAGYGPAKALSLIHI